MHNPVPSCSRIYVCQAPAAGNPPFNLPNNFNIITAGE